MRHARNVFAKVGLSLLAVPAALYIGCSSTKPTELVSGITTQMQVPKDLKAVGFIVQRNGGPPQCRSYQVEVRGDQGFVTLPRTLATEPAVDAKVPVTISILGFKVLPSDSFETDCLANPKSLSPGPTTDGSENEVVILRRARTPYVDGRILYMPMPLKQACSDVKCDDDKTCKAGKCVSMDIDPSKLVDYNDALIFGNTNTCFTAVESPAQQARGAVPCFPKVGTLPAQVVDKATCKYKVPLPDPLPAGVTLKGLNVRITHANFNTEVLDLEPKDFATLSADDREGFSIPDDSKPFEFQIAPNLCELINGSGTGASRIPPKIISVQTSVFCPSKTALQPICNDDLAVIQETGTGDPAKPNVSCFADASLTPAPSMLYVVMDRSASMSPFFGTKGLNQVLELSLQDPSLLSTQIGFKFAPAQAADCSATQTAPNPFASLTAPGDVPFQAAEPARQAIAAKVGDAANLLTTDGPVFLDAVLRNGGAYQALLNARQPQGQANPTRFNRQAVLVIGNRDFSTQCAGAGAGQSPADFAAAALAGPAKIATYAVVLGRIDNGGTPDDTSDDKRADQTAEIAAADALATAGGTSLFNATVDPAEGFKALTTVVNDLSSCLYQDVAELTAAKSTNKLASYNLSYLSFGFDGTSATSEKVDLAFNANCSEATQATETGWNLDPTDNRVRICGATCSTLRDSLLTSSLFAAASVPPTAAPGIAIRVNRPCE